MLSGLFIVGLGFSLQQIAANTLAVIMGDPATGSQRLTMAGGVSNLAATVGPLLVSIAIFGSVSAGNTEASIESVRSHTWCWAPPSYWWPCCCGSRACPIMSSCMRRSRQVCPGDPGRQRRSALAYRSWSWA
jgi:hypothetical protein